MPLRPAFYRLLLATRQKAENSDRDNARAAVKLALAKRQEREARLKLTETRKRLNGWST